MEIRPIWDQFSPLLFFCLKWILETLDHLRDPDLLLTKPKARSGQIRLLPVRNVTGDERAHARNKSSIFDVLNNVFDRAMKFFRTKRGYTHILSMNQLIFCCFCSFQHQIQRDSYFEFHYDCAR